MNDTMQCTICERLCSIIDGGIGGCGMVVRAGSEIRERYADRYLAAVDTAIESMPMVHYHPRGKFLQICTVGCNFKCRGCVSEILTDHFSAIEGSLQQMSAEQVIQTALSRNCMGIMFCFNEPTVSYFSFFRLAEMATKKGLLVGCSTNAYQTEAALEGLIPFLDFVNVGIKGFSKKTYRECGVADPAPIWRNLSLFHRRGVHVEVSAIFRKNGEGELGQVAEVVAGISRSIPFQVMRFIPFGDAPSYMEPSIREAEAVCEQLRRVLDHVYLFNTPGTDYLNSRCPVCGEKIIERGFFGPMCANLYGHRQQARCRCGYQLPVTGKIHDTDVCEAGYFGGYRTVNALNMIRSILEMLGVTEKDRMDAVMVRMLSENFIKAMYERMNRPEDYFETVEYFAALTAKTAEAKAFRRYAESRIGRIREKINGAKRPVVYFALGHPRIAVFEEKMESRLVEIAGGELAVRRIQRENRPGIPVSNEQFQNMRPNTIIISSAAAWPVADFISYCTETGMEAPAVEKKNVYHLHPYSASTKPDWVLGLMHLANLIHPECFDFDLEREADEFRRRFYGNLDCFAYSFQKTECPQRNQTHGKKLDADQRSIV